MHRGWDHVKGCQVNPTCPVVGLGNKFQDQHDSLFMTGGYGTKLPKKAMSQVFIIVPLSSIYNDHKEGGENVLKSPHIYQASFSSQMVLL